MPPPQTITQQHPHSTAIHERPPAELVRGARTVLHHLSADLAALARRTGDGRITHLANDAAAARDRCDRILREPGGVEA